jgi:hypothetical protein
MTQITAEQPTIRKIVADYPKAGGGYWSLAASIHNLIDHAFDSDEVQKDFSDFMGTLGCVAADLILQGLPITEKELVGLIKGTHRVVPVS